MAAIKFEIFGLINMPDLLLELLSEEIPARLQSGAEENLKKLVMKDFLDVKLTFEAAESFSTPRRLVLVISGLPEQTLLDSEEKRGPSVLAPKSAIDGFSKSMNIKSSELFKKLEKKGEFYYAKLDKKSQSSTDLIPDILSKVIRNFPWPKSMRWGSGSFKWVRPLHSVICLLSDESGYKVLPLDFDNIVSSNTSVGHRFMGPEKFTVSSFEKYKNKIKKGYVILDRDMRKRKIWNDATTLAFANGLEVVKDESLLDEVAGFVEWPVVHVGQIEKIFLSLPPEVLQVSMREHQKFFSLRRTGSLTIEAFVMVANLVTKDNGQSIVRGYERVLKARLSDAKFFWENDLRVIKLNGYANFSKKLKTVTFHNELGSEFQRVERITEIAAQISKMIGADLKSTTLAASLCKLDLVSEMVYEFPELQGIMGRCYAEQAGFSRPVFEACYEHYLPRRPLDDVPRQPVAVSLALADKIDSICNFWSINLKPTGSKDPFALRRLAIGIIRILLENELDLSLITLLKLGNSNLDFNDLTDFFNDRIRAHLIEKGISHDVLSSLLLKNYDDVCLKDIYLRALAIKTFVRTVAGNDLIQGYKRAVNILTAEEKKDGVEYSLDPNPSLMKEPSEKSLYEKLVEIDKIIIRDLKEKNVERAMQNLAFLRHPIDEFFSGVKINIDNSIIRRNRLCLLNQIKEVMHKVANFSKIDGEI